MSVFDTKQLNQEHIKVRWREPINSSTYNKKMFGTAPRGIYSGFNISVTGYRSYQVNQLQAINIHGSSTAYNQGAFSAVSGYSIAQFEDNIGYNTTVTIPPNAVSGTFDFDFIGVNNEKRILALDVDYSLSNPTTAQVLAVDTTEIDSNPDYLVIGVINLPDVGVSGSVSDIDYYDTDYPRTLPLATRKKYGYMSPEQVTLLESIGPEGDAIYCSSDDAEVWWRVFGDTGRLDFTGTINFHVPTEGFKIRLTQAGDVVSGIQRGDALYFTYPIDGSVSSATLQIGSSVSGIPEVETGYQLGIFGIRCNNDFWFKSGQKWEVGEKKPFGVTSKSPNLTVGETGNPPLSNNVSGIFFDNAQVTVLPGGKDVSIFVNVSGNPLNNALEEEFIVTSATQSAFTTTVSGFYWPLDLTIEDITVLKNGVKLIPFSDQTSGLTYSSGDPIWEFKKTGTRTIETREPIKKDGVITIRLEADRGIHADEETYVIASDGTTIVNASRPFNSNNEIPDIKVYRNGQKQQFWGSSTAYNPLIHNCTKTTTTRIDFFDLLNKDDVINIRYESTGVANQTAGGGGNFWSDPVDSDLEPDADNTYDIGKAVRFRNANFGGDVALAGDMYIGGKLNVSGAIDPTYIQFTPIDASEAPINSIYVNIAGNKLTFKNESSQDIDLEEGGGASGISLEEDEFMVNPYPFNIEAPAAISLSTSGNYFLLTDVNDPETIENYFGILRENVSAFGSGEESAIVRWRGKLDYITNNGSVYVSGMGGLSQSPPSVSGQSILRVGKVKNNEIFLMAGTEINL